MQVVNLTLCMRSCIIQAASSKLDLSCPVISPKSNLDEVCQGLGDYSLAARCIYYALTLTASSAQAAQQV